MAEFVIEDTLEQYPSMTPKELVDMLASQLSNADQVTMFLSHIQIPADSAITSATRSAGTSGTSSLGQSVSRPESMSGDHTVIETVLEMPTEAGGGSGLDTPSQVPEAQSTINADFLDRCRKALTRCVGPMAEFLLEDAYGLMPNATRLELIERLASDIPDGTKAAEFRQQMSAFVSSR